VLTITRLTHIRNIMTTVDTCNQLLRFYLAYYAAMTIDGGAGPVARQGAALDEFRALVRAAFEQAMSSGKPDWEQMTSAVLKNRLLNLTDREFSQARYGSASFIQLVRRVPDLIEIIDDKPPFHLRLIQPMSVQSRQVIEPEAVPRPKGDSPLASLAEGNWQRARIREDLWRAILDYSSHRRYVLDPDTGLARPEGSDGHGLSEFPTVSAEDVAEWRHEFVDSLPEPAGEPYEDELRTWLTSSGRLAELPKALRSGWAEFLKRKVGVRLLEWYAERGESPPSDFLVDSDTRALPPAEAIDEVVRTRQLRDLVIRAVRTMTYDELSDIRLPASIILRITRNKPSYGPGAT
jgi:hypothetical protein